MGNLTDQPVLGTKRVLPTTAQVNSRERCSIRRRLRKNKCLIPSLSAINEKMTDVSDMELLRNYDRQGSEEAFAVLVRRHINLVYSVAFRHVGVAAHAEEITQAVFVILARKVASLRPDTILEGWLYATTRLTALSFRRGERRRQFREQEAYMQSTLQPPDDVSVWNQLAPLLDEAISRLGKKDRDAVMLRFFKEKSLREVAAALDVNETAAQRRVHRAVEKLRRFLTKRGVVLPAAALVAAISANSVQAAPVGLATTISAVAIAKGATVSSSTLTLIKGALKIMAWTKVKTAVLVGLSVILTASVAPHVWYYHLGPDSWRHRFEAFYRLKDGQVLKYVAPANFIPERAQFYRLFYFQGETPRGCCYNQIGHEIAFAGGVGGETISLHDTLCYLFRFNQTDIEGPDALMFLNVTGDWTLREGSSRESLLAALEPILAKITGHSIQFQKQTVERDVIVAHGTPRNNPDDFKVLVYSEDPNSDLVEGSTGDIKRFLESVGNRVRVQFIDETSDDARSMQRSAFRWETHIDTESGRMGARRAELTDKVLKNISAQTGLAFTHEKRAMEIWMVTEDP